MIVLDNGRPVVARMLLKACPHCRTGDLIQEKYPDYSCLQCGEQVDLKDLFRLKRVSDNRLK